MPHSATRTRTRTRTTTTTTEPWHATVYHGIVEKGVADCNRHRLTKHKNTHTHTQISTINLVWWRIFQPQFGFESSDCRRSCRAPVNVVQLSSARVGVCVYVLCEEGGRYRCDVECIRAQSARLSEIVRKRRTCERVSSATKHYVAERMRSPDIR